MKKILVLAFLFFTAIGFAQDDVEVKGNTVTMRETAPIWPGCEDSTNKKACFNKQMVAHVKANYKYPKNKEGEFIHGKATVSMEVNEKGDVVVHSVEGKFPKINAEAERMVKKMPKMTPGKKGGKATSIKYTIPFNF